MSTDIMQTAMTIPATVGMTIDGCEVQTPSTFGVVNPATEEVLGWAPDATKDDLDAAIAAARAAFPAWRDTSIDERRRLVRAIGNVLRENLAELSRLLTSEQGKPLEAARGEIEGAAYWCDGICEIDLPVTVHEDTSERRSTTRHVPLGVVGAIAPWNFPIILAIWKLAPALVTGNTIVLKPSPFTPLTTLRLGELLRGILPRGVVNVISGGEQLGPWMTSHPGFDKISFTGSSNTGAKVMASAAETLKRVTLELGGNDAAIVLPDADVEKIVEPLFWSAFQNSGQICVASKRIYIHDTLYDRLAAALADYARSVKVGDGLEQGTQVGPVNNHQQFARVRELIEDARTQGLHFIAGGEIPQMPGYFIPLTLIDNPPDDARIVIEEQFGPVVPLMRFSDTEDVIRRANDTPYGLAGSIWTSDLDAAEALAQRIDTGTVWINEAHYSAPFIPFGGHKSSGVGVESGIEGLLEYTNTQTIIMRK